MGDTNLSLIDLKALSEPASKLIEAVRDAIGVVYEPTRIRRRAKAEADAAIIKLEGEAELFEIAERAAERIKNRELRRQQNIESIVGDALHYLPETVSEERPDEDWVVQFFENCQDVSNKEMQSLWAKLLAGEVSRPGSYSPRTLHLIKLLRKADADLFTHFCNYAWGYKEDGPLIMHLWTKDTDTLLESKGLPYDSVLHLSSLGLIVTGSAIDLHTDNPPELTYYGKKYSFSVELKTTYNKSMESYLLTDAGKELSIICGSYEDREYLETLIKSLKGYAISVTRVGSYP
jgi:uncharacterized repeat protein (TIGR03899 family)